MEFEFSWMAYFVSLFALMVCSIALSLLCPGAGKRVDGGAREHSANVPSASADASHDAPGQAAVQPERNAMPAHPGNGV